MGFIARFVGAPIGYSFRPRERVGIHPAEAGLGCMSDGATNSHAFCRKRRLVPHAGAGLRGGAAAGAGGDLGIEGGGGRW